MKEMNSTLIDIKRSSTEVKDEFRVKSEVSGYKSRC